MVHSDHRLYSAGHECVQKTAVVGQRLLTHLIANRLDPSPFDAKAVGVQIHRFDEGNVVQSPGVALDRLTDEWTARQATFTFGCGPHVPVDIGILIFDLGGGGGGAKRKAAAPLIGRDRPRCSKLDLRWRVATAASSQNQGEHLYAVWHIPFITCASGKSNLVLHSRAFPQICQLWDDTPRWVSYLCVFLGGARQWRARLMTSERLLGSLCPTAWDGTHSEQSGRSGATGRICADRSSALLDRLRLTLIRSGETGFVESKARNRRNTAVFRVLSNAALGRKPSARSDPFESWAV